MGFKKYIYLYYYRDCMDKWQWVAFLLISVATIMVIAYRADLWRSEENLE